MSPFPDIAGYVRKGRIGGGGWVHPKGTDSMAVSGFCFTSALVGSECYGQTARKPHLPFMQEFNIERVTYKSAEVN